MKRFSLALMLLLAGTAGVLGLGSRANHLQQQLTETQRAFQVQTQQITALETEWSTLSGQIQGLKSDLRVQRGAPDLLTSPLAALLDTNRLAQLSAAQRERLFAELGLDWHASDQWIVVSKAALHQIRMNAIRNGKLIDGVASVLALSPDERQHIDDAYNRTRDQFVTWAKANLRREEPTGDVVARYIIPYDPTFSDTLKSQLINDITATIGEERAELLKEYSDYWIQGEAGYFGGATNTLTVVRGQDEQGKPSISYNTAREAPSGSPYGSMTSTGQMDTVPKSLPAPFHLVLPGGWKELAKREGFTLPVEEPVGGK